MPKLFSVVIPTYNRAARLGAAIDSVLAQDFADCELIVVDDCSPDDTAAVLARYAPAGVKGLRAQRNGGVSAARNLGITQAAGRYVVFLDDDDALLPGALAAIAAHHLAHPDIAFSWGGVRSERLGANGEVVDRGEQRWLPADGGAVGPERTEFVLHVGTNYALCVRRDAFERIGLFDTSLPRSEDRDLLLRLAQAGYRGMGIDRALVAYRIHGFGSLTNPQGRGKTPDADERVVAKHATFLRLPQNRALLGEYYRLIFGLYCDHARLLPALRYLGRVTRLRPELLPKCLDRLLRVFSGLEYLKNRLGYYHWKEGRRLRRRTAPKAADLG